jgi:alpha-L-glutamate ligase-like protein
MNARNFLYIKSYNHRRHKVVADNKLLTKELLLREGVPTTSLVATFRDFNDVRRFAWQTLPKSFVLKPARGYGGQGIIVVKEWDGTTGKTSRGKTVDIPTLEREIFSILDGAFSLNNLPDTAFVEQRVLIHQFFKKLAVGGVPDIRVIVWNRVPVMAMLRLPTSYSDGKANLHLGALGVGIDMRTGITTYGIMNDHPVTTIPGSKVKVRGIKIPDWKKILHIASRAQEVSRLGFAGIDLVLEESEGPLVLEVNARPGLAIQLANQASLRTRLDRIAHMKVTSPERAVELAQTLFADSALQDIPNTDNILHVIEKITIYGNSKKKTVRAKIDTGAYRTALDIDLVHELGLDTHDKLVHVRAGSGHQRRKTTKLRFKLRGKEINTIATYSERGHMRFPVIVGRRDLKGFYVDPMSIPNGVKVK